MWLNLHNAVWVDGKKSMLQNEAFQKPKTLSGERLAAISGLLAQL